MSQKIKELEEQVRKLDEAIKLVKDTLREEYTKEEKAKKEKALSKMTHVGLYQGRRVWLRETKNYFIDRTGYKYRKDTDNTAVACYDRWHLDEITDICTIEEYRAKHENSN
jgi:hypothetical protein